MAGNVFFANNSTGERGARLLVNGTGVGYYVRQAADSPLRLNVSGVLILAANDYIELDVYQTSGGNLDLTANAANRMGVTRVA